MRITLFEIFGIQIKSYGLMIAIGIIVASSLFINKGKKKGFNEDSLLNLIIFAVIGGILGGKLLFIITEFKDILKDRSILLNFGYGFVIYGAIFGGLLAMYLYCKKSKWNTLEIVDMTVPGLAIAQGFGRIGCFLAGCCYGKETTLPIGVEFPTGSLAPSGIHLHPTQIYSSIFDFILGLFLLYYSRKERNLGKVTGMYLILYSIGRFTVEFFRNDPRGNVGILSTSQFIAIFTLIIGIVLFNIHKIFKGEKDMFRKKRLLILSLIMLLILTLSGCTLSDNIELKLGLRNQQFEYIKQNRVDKIIIQSVRDSGFRFIINDSQAITDIYKLLSTGKEVSEKSSMEPDYVFEVWIGDQVKKYKYVVGADERQKGNFYDDSKAFSISKNLDDTIMQNLSFIRKPRDFEYVYYQSILKVLEGKKKKLSSDNKVGIDISSDTDCLKYMFSMDLQEFNKDLKETLPNVDIVKNNSEKFNTIVKVKNRGYSTTVFKTLITIEDKKNKSFESYYVSAEYNFKDWDINISEVNKMPQDW